MLRSLLLALASCGLACPPALSGTLEFKILVNWQEPSGLGIGLNGRGPHTLTILARTSAFGDEGGILETSIDISDSERAITWNEGVGFLGGNGQWGSSSNPSMSEHEPGTLANGQILAESSRIPAADWESRWRDVGTRFLAYDVIASGDFYWKGPERETTIYLEPGAWNGHKPGIVTAVPPEVVHYTSQLIRFHNVPEPSSCCLAMLAALAGAARCRHR